MDNGVTTKPQAVPFVIHASVESEWSCHFDGEIIRPFISINISSSDINL